MHHFAASLEDHAFVHAQAGRQDVSPKNRRVMNLYTMLRLHGSVDLAADDHGARLDGTVDPGALTHDQGIWGIDFSTKGATDPNGALKAKFALKLTAVINDAGHRVLGRWNT